MKVFRDRTRKWRIEQRGCEVIIWRGGCRLWHGPVWEVDRWLREHHDPVDEWVED